MQAGVVRLKALHRTQKVVGPLPGVSSHLDHLCSFGTGRKVNDDYATVLIGFF